MLTPSCWATSVTRALQITAMYRVVAEDTSHPKSKPENFQATNARHLLAYFAEVQSVKIEHCWWARVSLFHWNLWTLKEVSCVCLVCAWRITQSRFVFVDEISGNSSMSSVRHELLWLLLTSLKSMQKLLLTSEPIRGGPHSKLLKTYSNILYSYFY